MNYESYMHRCLFLASLGRGNTGTNPMVGSVLVNNERIIGEGYHEVYGGPHAEVNCFNSVSASDQDLVAASTLFVSLEPCAHYGKTPPCADLIISKGVKKLVIGCRDPFPEVDGKGIEKLRAAGVEIIYPVLEQECRQLNKSFFHYHEQHRPYILLKWAQTADAKIAAASASRLLISNGYSNRLVHQWRAGTQAILVGSRTAQLDDPFLNTRLWPGKSPIRLVLDPELELPEGLNIFQNDNPVIVFNYRKHSIEDLKTGWKENAVHFYQITQGVSAVEQVVHALYQMNIQSLMVEGGAMLLQSFIDEGLWDHASVIINPQLKAGEGLPAPIIQHYSSLEKEQVSSDLVHHYKR